MIIVTGATGQLGQRIIGQLVGRMSADRIGATTRDPRKAHALARAGVSVRHGDFAEPDTLRAAFEGATQVLIVSSNGERSGMDVVAQHRGAIDAARAAGARRVVYTSHMGASSTSAFRPMHTHAGTEAVLREAGIAWTSLRNGFYAQTVPAMMVGDAAKTGFLGAPVDGKVAWTTHDDLAAAAAAVLFEEGRFEGPTPPLTGAEALDLADVAALLAHIHGRPVERRIVTDEVFADGMRVRGTPEPVIEIALGMYRAARAGEFASTDPTLAMLLGRAPTSLRSVLDDN